MVPRHTWSISSTQLGSTFASGTSPLGRPRCLAVDPVIRVGQAPKGKFSENSPHLLGNIEKGKSKKKSSRVGYLCPVSLTYHASRWQDLFWPSLTQRLINPMDPTDKPDPYGEWVLLGTKQGPGGPPLAVDEELLAAARAAWPRVLAHVRGELFDKELGPERTALAADIWDRVLRSVAKTRQRNKDHRPPISDLQSYLIGVFHHRFNRLLTKEQRRAETIELVSSVLDLERFEAALDTEWAEQLERSIAVRQITDRMDAWTKKVWEARQYEYTWKEIASWLGITEQQAKMKFRYNLEKIRQNIVRLLKRKTVKKAG